MTNPALFSDWTSFHMLVGSSQLDVVTFNLSNYGINRCPTLTAIVYCPRDQFGQLLHEEQEVTLVVRYLDKFTSYLCAINTLKLSNYPAPEGYLAVELSAGSGFWQRLSCYGCRAIHRQSLKACLQAVLVDVGLATSQYGLLYLKDEPFHTLRMSYNQPLAEFIINALAESEAHYTSHFSETGEKVLFSHYLNQFEQSESRTLMACEPNAMVGAINNGYVSCKKYMATAAVPYLQLQLTCHDVQAYPGELVQVEGEEYRVVNVAIEGEHAFRFDSNHQQLPGAAVITATVTLLPVEANPWRLIKSTMQSRSTLPRTWALYTGQLEATPGHEANNEVNYPALDEQGRYQARFDFEEQLGARQAPHCAYPPARQGEALTALAQNSLMPSSGYGVVLPLMPKTEVLLSVQEDPLEPTYILGAVTNQQSPAVVTAELPNHNVFRTVNNSCLTIEDSPSARKVELTTPDRQHLLSLDGASGKVQLKTQQGSINVHVSENMIKETKESLHLQMSGNVSIEGGQESRLTSHQHDVIVVSDKQAYHASQDMLRMQTQDTVLQAQEAIQVKANTRLEINTDALLTQSVQEKNQWLAETIVIKGDSLVASSEGAILHLDGEECVVKATEATVNTPKGLLQTDMQTLGGKPQQPLTLKPNNIEAPIKKHYPKLEEIDLTIK